MGKYRGGMGFQTQGSPGVSKPPTWKQMDLLATLASDLEYHSLEEAIEDHPGYGNMRTLTKNRASALIDEMKREQRNKDQG